MEAVLVAVLASLVGAAIIGTAKIIKTWARGRFATPPIKVTLDASIPDAPWFGVFGTMPINILSNIRAGIDRGKTISMRSIAYLSNTPLAVRIYNTSGDRPRNVRLLDVIVTIRDYLPLEEHVADNPVLVSAGTIQAGGRGAEADYIIWLCTNEIPLWIPVMKAGAVEEDTTYRHLTIRPDDFVAFHLYFRPVVAGCYVVDIALSLEWEAKTKELPVMSGLRIVKVADWSWAKAGVATFNWYDPEILSVQDIRRGEADWLQWQSTDVAPCQCGRKVIVQGSVDDWYEGQTSL